MAVEIVGHEDGTHLTFAGRSTVQIRDHDEGHNLPLHLTTMVDLLRQFIQRGSKDIDAFVLPFLASGDADKEGILRHDTA